MGRVNAQIAGLKAMFDNPNLDNTVLIILLITVIIFAILGSIAFFVNSTGFKFNK